VLAAGLETSKLDRAEGLTAEAFQDRYYARNEPVVITDLRPPPRRRSAWTHEKVKATLANRSVRVLAYEPPDGAVARDTPYEWSAQIAAIVPPDDDRLPGGIVHDLDVLSDPELAAGFGQLSFDRRFLTRDASARDVGLVAGGTGCRSPLHREDRNHLLAVTAGRVGVTLVSPLDSHCLYFDGDVSPVDPAEPDLARFPRWLLVRAREVVAYPGESVFVPVGWWLQLEALEPATALTLRNFVVLNDFSEVDDESAIEPLT